MIDENCESQHEVLEEISKIDSDITNEDVKIKYLMEQYEHVKDWTNIFDEATTDAKKMILARLIKKRTIYRGYRITIHFFITPVDFAGNFSGVEEPEEAVT